MVATDVGFENLKKTILADGQYSNQIKQVIEDGSVPLADISLGVKQGHDYANQRLPTDFLKVVINHNGDLIAYCKYCDEYVSYNEMSAKAREAYGIIPFCRPCYNLYKRTLSSKSAKAPSIAKSFSPQKIEEYVDITMRGYLHSGQSIPQNLIDYRQALLDVPQNNTPEVNEDLELINVNWPTKPE